MSASEKTPAKIPTWVVLSPFVVALLGLVALFTRAPRLERSAAEPAQAATLTALPPESSPSPAPTSDSRPLLAIVIDDLGYDLPALERLLALQVPLTYAVLPGRPHSAEAAARVAREGRELILHQPMEAQTHPDDADPYGESKSPDPGPGAVFLSMDDETITAQVERNLDRFPGIVGMNNHMGSRFTRDGLKLRAALAPLLKRGLYFLDSRTAPDSVAFETAKQMRLRAVQRDVFLDHEMTVEAVGAQFERLLRIAKTEGYALAIGHPHPETVEVLERELPRMGMYGVHLVPAGVLATRLSEQEPPQLIANDAAPAP